MKQPHADVAELADAQVSEACDGDIVEVQVLSSAPKFRASSQSSPFLFVEFGVPPSGGVARHWCCPNKAIHETTPNGEMQAWFWLFRVSSWIFTDVINDLVRSLGFALQLPANHHTDGTDNRTEEHDPCRMPGFIHRLCVGDVSDAHLMSVSGSQRGTQNPEQEAEYQYHGSEGQRRFTSPGDGRTNQTGDQCGDEDHRKLHHGPTRGCLIRPWPE